MSEPDQKMHGGHAREMTVAHVRRPEGEPCAEVMFLESPRIYRLSKENPGYDAILRVLRGAMARGGAVRIRLASLESEAIEDAQELKPVQR